ncbi:MAG: hypothetical protein OEU54_16640 [Gemmatimonadota bacterium]|nr:hypothetical protein [Gemmatimonadota bacterium]
MNSAASLPEARREHRLIWGTALGLGLAIASTPASAAPRYGPERRCESILPAQLDLHVKKKHLERFRDLGETGADGKAIPVTIGTAEGPKLAEGRLTLSAGPTGSRDPAISYRISWARDEPAFGIFGMQLRRATASGAHARAELFALLCAEGIVVPRTTTLPVSLNREPLGELQLIERPAKQMLEHRQRRDGVLMRVEPVPDRHTVRFVPLDRGDVLRSEERGAHFDVARALAQGFFRRELPAADVFDLDVMARFLAVAATSDAAPLLALPNLLFYFNPITLLLEPVAFDGELAVRPGILGTPPTAAWFAQSRWATRLLEDEPLRIAVNAHVQRLTNGSIIDPDALRSASAEGGALRLQGGVALDAHPLPTASREDALAKHPFLRWVPEGETFVVRPGIWRVDGSLVLPSGAGLEVSGGTTLRFPEHGMLLASGPLRFAGDAAHPIVLEGNPSPFGPRGWQGVVVLRSARPHHWSGVRVRHTRGIELGPWRLTGGVTFRESEVRLEDSTFEGNRAEDALNLIRTRFDLVRVSVRDTPSDALDADFSVGTIRGGRFTEVGGDGIDVSGSRVEVHGTALARVRDKAISVGEGSEVEAHEVSIRDAGTALACKDASHATLQDSTLRQIHHAALMAYVKKPEYGPATIKAERLEIDSPQHAVVQVGSRIRLDGLPVEPSRVDPDELYRAGFMKK